MIEVKNLTKKYGSHVAVDNLSFEVEEGKITGFLGPNGAGKSTTMNMMTGFIAPTSGTVLINGIDILKEPEEAKKLIGYLPEQPPVYMDMTVREYLTFVAELKKVPKKERAEQVDKIEEIMEITDVEGRLIRNLSKGYRQRVGFAQALVGFPPTIILDEPMVGLDPKQIIEIRDLIKKLKENHTVILSSHILSEINMVCDKIMIISHGKLVAYDTPENLIAAGTSKEEVRLTAKGSKDAVAAVLASIEGLTYELTEDGALCKAVIDSASDPELSEKLFSAFAAAHIAITELNHQSSSLEDIFLELTGSSDEVKEAEAVPVAQPEAEAAAPSEDATKEDNN